MFNISDNVYDTAVRWTKWEKKHQATVQVLRTNRSSIKDGLIIYGGSQIADLEESLPDLPPQESEDAYSRFIRKLDRNFLPRKNKDYSRFQFRNLAQEADESMAKHYARLCDIAKKCEFNDEDDAIRDYLIKTMNTNRIQVKTIRSNWTPSQILDGAAVEEESTAQAHEIDQKLQDATEFQKIKQVIKDKCDRSATCYRCGSKHARGNCKAYGAKCFKCGKQNHNTRMCRSTDSKDHTEEKREKSSH